MICFGKQQASSERKRFDDALKAQKEARRKKEEIALQKKLDNSQEEYIIAIYFFEQYHSQRAWTTAEEATNIYSRLPNEAQQLKAVKEQILIRYLGLGWNEAHHPWSSGGTTFSSRHLFNHLVQKVIPLANKYEVSQEPPLTLPAPSNLPQLGEKSVIAETLQVGWFQNMIQFKEKAHSIRDEREKEGRGDQWSEQQRSLMPEVDSTLIGF
mmetsp:Transcript_9817/g.20905  ORF Transcript_9817/g.20905 Transcript_9817/m.20905 type:complete len:211 (-) Transcript_9817:255-887(-)